MVSNRTPFHLGKGEGGGLFIADQRLFAGNIWFVDSEHNNAGDSIGKGQTPDNPFATIDYAVGQCTANQGDVILASPRHAETITTAGAIDLDISGIKLIGVGEGQLRPTITFGAAAAQIDVDAANITLENLIFKAGAASVTLALDINANGCTLRNCLFYEDTTNENYLGCIGAASVNFTTVDSCTFICPDTDASYGVLLDKGSYGRITNCVFLGDWSQGAVTIGTAGTGHVVDHNLIWNADDTADKCIGADTATTGICANNRVGSADTQGNQITAENMVLCENYAAVSTEDLQGILDPVET